MPLRPVGGLLGIAVIGLLVVTIASGSVAAQAGDDGFHHHDGWMGTHGGMGGWMVGGFGFLWMILWTLVDEEEFETRRTRLLADRD